MTVLESLPVAAFVFVMVFAVLAFLCALIILFSRGIQVFEKRGKSNTNTAIPELVPEVEEAVFSSGDLKLRNVDERTAAMVMAIVSDESGIPLYELVFKSIKAI